MNQWERKYRTRLIITDIAVVIYASFGAQILRFGFQGSSFDASVGKNGVFVSYTATSSVLILLWLYVLALFGTRKAEILGAGPEEYRRTVRATLFLFAAIAIFAYLTELPLARSYLLIALPTGVFGLLISRWLWRQWLGTHRLRGGFLNPAVIVGSASSADIVALQLQQHPEAGFSIVGCFLSGSSQPSTQSQQIFLKKSKVPILGGFADTIPLMRHWGATTIIVASADDLSHEDVRQLSWALTPGQEHLVLAPSMLDVSGPRLHMYPVAGLPLIRLEAPAFSGVRAVVKRLFDLFVSVALLVLLSPVFVVIAIAIKRNDAGPVFFTQERVGFDGRTFKMIKFRTMSTSAEVEREVLIVTTQQKYSVAGNGVLFKLKDDPRITTVGKTLRKYSLDELPQLLNVFVNDMSLVGPRPPLPSEVAQYEDHVKRKFFMKPGITGQWQISGRSDLSWDESVRADLMYIENWSFINDLLILWKTTSAVVKSSGAY